MFWKKKEKLISWEELQEELNKPETIFDKITTPFYKIENFVIDLFYYLKPQKIKNTLWLIKFSWKYLACDWAFGIIMLKWHTDNLIQTYESEMGYYDEGLNQLKEFSTTLEKLLNNEPVEEDVSQQIRNIRDWWV